MDLIDKHLSEIVKNLLPEYMQIELYICELAEIEGGQLDFKKVDWIQRLTKYQFTELKKKGKLISEKNDYLLEEQLYEL